MDAAERSFVAKIREHGWFRTGVLADEESPGFSYTTGVWANTGQPELITFSLKADIAHNVLWDMFREAQAGRRLSVGRRLGSVFANLPAYAFPVARSHYPEFLGWSRWFYGGDDFPCLQIVWPDRAGLFPWEPGFAAEFSAYQTDLTERGWPNEIAE